MLPHGHRPTELPQGKPSKLHLKATISPCTLHGFSGIKIIVLLSFLLFFMGSSTVVIYCSSSNIGITHLKAPISSKRARLFRATLRATIVVCIIMVIILVAIYDAINIVIM